MAVQITGRQIANAAVNVNKLDLSTGTFDFTSAVLQVATPSADNHAAPKSYVDSIAQGLHWKDSVRVATTANITLSGTQTIDGISVVADDRVLVKNQSTGSENGIYLCKAGSWVRSGDMNESDEFSGSAIFIQQGTANADTGYVCTNDGAVTVGTTSIQFTQFTGAGQLTGGAGIDITGSDISVNVDDSSIEISGDALQVKSGGITNAMLAGSITAAKLAGSIPSDKLNLGNGVEDNGGNLQINLDGATLALGADGISIASGGVDSTQLAADSVVSAKIADGAIDASAYLADSVVTNAKLAGSITAAKLAGSIPSDKLNLGNGVEDNGGNLQINLDGATLALGADGISIASGGVDTAQLADDSVTTGKLDFAGFFAAFDADGSTAGFELSAAVDLGFKEFFVVTVNGLVIEYKETPDSQDNYKIANDGTGSVGKITFGANLSNGDRVTIRGFINN